MVRMILVIAREYNVLIAHLYIYLDKIIKYLPLLM